MTLANKGGFQFNDADSVVHKGKGKKGKECEDKKESFVFLNRAFPVGKKASSNSARPSGGCNDKVSSISRPFCVSSAPRRSGILVDPGARLESTLCDIRSFSAPGSDEISLGDVLEESVVHVASGFRGAGAAFLNAMSEIAAPCETDRLIAESECRPSATSALDPFATNKVVLEDGCRGARILSGGGEPVHATAGEIKEITGLLEVRESDFSKKAGVAVAAATAGESDGNLGLRRVIESHSRHNSSWGVDAVACARVSALPVVSATASSSAAAPASPAVVAHARSTPMHVAVNSWSDTVSSQGHRGRRSSKGGVSGPAEDLLPVSEVEAAVIFVGRPAVYGGRLQVHFQVGNQALVPGYVVGVVTPSIHPEVTDSLFVSPRPGKGIRQSMGWRKVCGAARPGILVLKCNARTRMLPANLDHLRGMDFSGIIRDCLGHARARLFVSMQVWSWSNRKTTN